MEGNIVATKKIKAEIEERDGGYYYPQLDIHVMASTQKEARELVKEYHGIDVDEVVTQMAAAAKAAEKAEKQANKE